VDLKKYKEKRNFEKTKKPLGKNKKNKFSKKNIYVIQKHDASYLHYDLRLEFNGLLKSWAIPKLPPKRKGLKRLAIQTEDHPIKYAKFEGIIPEGNYGAGKVEIWDKGTFVLIKKNSKKIEFEINGKKLKGKYILIKTKYGKSKEQKKKTWLFFKIE
jgi:DNA ligase D-like protein (predicted 3'-phosphoesterase)